MSSIHTLTLLSMFKACSETAMTCWNMWTTLLGEESNPQSFQPSPDGHRAHSSPFPKLEGRQQWLESMMVLIFLRSTLKLYICWLTLCLLRRNAIQPSLATLLSSSSLGATYLGAESWCFDWTTAMDFRLSTAACISTFTMQKVFAAQDSRRCWNPNSLKCKSSSFCHIWKTVLLPMKSSCK